MNSSAGSTTIEAHAALCDLHQRSRAEFLAAFRRQREKVMQFIRSLAENPNTGGDFSEPDDARRTVQVKIIGRYAITFWADHAVSEIKVTHVKAAD